MAIVNYSLDVGGKTLNESIGYTIPASTYEGPPEVWWKRNVQLPLQRFVHRYDSAYVYDITYIWIH